MTYEEFTQLRPGNVIRRSVPGGFVTEDYLLLDRLTVIAGWNTVMSLSGDMENVYRERLLDVVIDQELENYERVR